MNQPTEIDSVCSRLRAAKNFLFKHGYADSANEIEDVIVCIREADAEIRRLHEQVKTEHRAGIEAAAKWHDEQAAYCVSFSGGGWHLHSQRVQHEEYATAKRAAKQAVARPMRARRADRLGRSRCWTQGRLT